MNAEKFFFDYLADSSLALKVSALQVIQEVVNPRKKSLVAVYAQELRNAGQSGLTERFKDYNPRQRVSFGVELLTQIDTGSTVLGETILALEEALSTEVFDIYRIVDSVNSALRAANSRHQCSQPRVNMINLRYGEWRDIITSLKQDPTFAIFLKEPQLLPRVFMAYLENEKVYGKSILSTIQTLVLPDYEKRAKLLILQNE